MQRTTPLTRVLIMLALVTAGEAIFLLPFGLGRMFRPAMLDYFQVTNLQLGVAYSIYGFIAMAAYFAGGPLADRFSARRLMGIALIATATGGVVLTFVRSHNALHLVYGFWGMTTILLFWAALIRATREWGAADQQGRAFGILDGGRGLTAAVFSSIAVLLFSMMLPENASEATLDQRMYAFERIMWIVIGLMVAITTLVWRFVPDRKTAHSQIEDGRTRPKLTLDGVRQVLRMPAIRLQALIIVCAYVAFRSTDNVSLLAQDVYGYNDVEAAQLGTYTFWARPVAAIGAGFLSDRLSPSRVLLVCFVILIAGSLVLTLGVIPPGIPWILATTLIAVSIGIYAMRGIYFALFGEGRVPLAVTGSAVGVVSVIGYTPDVFMSPLMGYLLDRSPGELGHQHVYGVVLAFAVLGLLATLRFRHITRGNSAITTDEADDATEAEAAG